MPGESKSPTPTITTPTITTPTIQTLYNITMKTIVESYIGSPDGKTDLIEILKEPEPGTEMMIIRNWLNDNPQLWVKAYLNTLEGRTQLIEPLRVDSNSRIKDWLNGNPQVCLEKTFGWDANVQNTLEKWLQNTPKKLGEKGVSEKRLPISISVNVKNDTIPSVLKQPFIHLHIIIGDGNMFKTNSFISCSNLTKVTVGNNNEFEMNAFSNSYITNPNRLKTVTIGNGNKFGMNSFHSCSNITKVTVGNDNTFELYAFKNCGDITTVTLGDNNTFKDTPAPLTQGGSAAGESKFSVGVPLTIRLRF